MWGTNSEVCCTGSFFSPFLSLVSNSQVCRCITVVSNTTLCDVLCLNLFLCFCKPSGPMANTSWSTVRRWAASLPLLLMLLSLPQSCWTPVTSLTRDPSYSTDLGLTHNAHCYILKIEEKKEMVWFWCWFVSSAGLWFHIRQTRNLYFPWTLLQTQVLFHCWTVYPSWCI